MDSLSSVAAKIDKPRIFPKNLYSTFLRDSEMPLPMIPLQHLPRGMEKSFFFFLWSINREFSRWGSSLPAMPDTLPFIFLLP